MVKYDVVHKTPESYIGSVRKRHDAHVKGQKLTSEQEIEIKFIVGF